MDILFVKILRPSSQETRAWKPLFLDSKNLMKAVDWLFRKIYIHLIFCMSFLVFMGTLQASEIYYLSQTAFSFDFLHHSGWRTKNSFFLWFLCSWGSMWPGSDHCDSSQCHCGGFGKHFLNGSSLAGTLHQFFALCIFALLSASQECRQNSWRNSSYHTFVMIKAMEQRQLSKKTEGTGDVLDSSATTGWFTLGPLIKWDSTLSCLIHWSRIFCYSESSPNWWYWLINISTCYVPVQFKHFIY